MRILIIQHRRIGDILLTTPVITYLRSVFPDATIDFLCQSMGKTVLETHPGLNEILVYQTGRVLTEALRIRRRRYDAVLDFMNNPPSSYATAMSGARWKVGFKAGGRGIFYNVRVPVPTEPEYVPARKLRLVRTWLERAGLPSPTPSSVRPVLHLPDEDTRFATSWAATAAEGKPYAVLAPAHRHPIRAWRSDGFKAAALHLARRQGLKTFLAWGPGEEAVVGEVRKGNESEVGLLPLTSLRQMAAIFQRAKVVVTNDSGAMHLAVSVNAPTVTIYGPTRPVDWNPSLAGAGPRDKALTADGVDCLGCHLAECPVGHLCMKRLSDERVAAACDFVLKEK